MAPVVVNERPPIFDRLVEAFPKAACDGVIFAFGDKIYNPSSIVIPPPLMAHELVHCERQRKNVDQWWEKYITDPAFRYNEEVYSHVAEFRAQMPHDRNDRSKLLMHTAQRLIAPLYNYGIKSLNQALCDLRFELEHKR